MLCGNDVVLGSFAYPFGDVTLARKLQLQRMFGTCRGISPGINRDRVDLGLLKAVSLYDRSISQADIERLIDEVVWSKGWLIFYTHDVEHDSREFGTSTALFRFCVSLVRAKNCEILTMRNALGNIAFRT